MESHLEDELRTEMSKYNDIVILDTNDEFDTVSHKTLAYLREIPNEYPAAFYFKGKPEAAVNLHELAKFLKDKQTTGNLYMGCMKSGPVCWWPISCICLRSSGVGGGVPVRSSG